MKFEHYLKRAKESKEFKQFSEKNKQAYLCAGFFVLDFESGKHMHQVDFFVPSNKKMATFLLEDGVKLNFSQGAIKKKPKELADNIRIDIDALKGIVEDEMHNRTITHEVKKIIAVIQVIDDKKTWVLNCITDGLGLIRVNIDDADESILKFEKANLMDFIKKVSADDIKVMKKESADDMKVKKVDADNIKPLKK